MEHMLTGCYKYIGLIIKVLKTDAALIHSYLTEQFLVGREYLVTVVKYALIVFYFDLAQVVLWDDLVLDLGAKLG